MERFSIRQLWLPAVAVGLLWLLLIRQVGNSWSVVPQYNYGWFMPMLAGVVWWGRWKTRSEPGAAPFPSVLTAVAVGLIVLLLPIRLIQESNRDWLLVSWAIALVATGLVALALLWTGGWPWLRHFAFPLLFPLAAVPWPSKLEQPVVHDLMAVVAEFGAEILSGMGIPAMAHGSVVEIGRGLVGIDEACSGIQSFQASVMVSLFVGELFAFSVIARFVILLASMGWAFVCNLSRTVFLTYICDRDGYAALDEYHDSAGVVVMCVCYLGIIALALFMSRNIPQPKPTSPVSVPRKISAAVCWFFVACVAVAEAGTLAWYGRTAESAAKRAPWTVELKQGQPGFHAREFSGRERTILRYNDAKSASWKSDKGHRWQVSFIRWDAGNLAVNTAKHHNPTICLVGSGWEMKEEFPTRSYAVAGQQVPFRSFRFAQGKAELISFFCLWDDYDRPPPSLGWKWTEEQWTARYRMQSVLAGRRTTGLQLYNASVSGCPDWEMAAREFTDVLAKTTMPR